MTVSSQTNVLVFIFFLKDTQSQHGLQKGLSEHIKKKKKKTKIQNQAAEQEKMSWNVFKLFDGFWSVLVAKSFISEIFFQEHPGKERRDLWGLK